jgi:hypothetical protein
MHITSHVPPFDPRDRMAHMVAWKDDTGCCSDGHCDQAQQNREYKDAGSPLHPATVALGSSRGFSSVAGDSEGPPGSGSRSAARTEADPIPAAGEDAY